MLLIFRLRDFISVLFYRLIGMFSFKKMGKGTRIVFPLRIMGSAYITLEDNVTLQFRSFVSAMKIHDENPELIIKEGTLIGNYAHIICTKKILIGANVLMADKIYISDNLHGYEDINVPIHTQSLKQIGEVIIGERSWIGENVCIIGAKVGKHCVIGANSVVTRDIPDYSVAVGSPAIPIKRYCFSTDSWRKVNDLGDFY